MENKSNDSKHEGRTGSTGKSSGSSKSKSSSSNKSSTSKSSTSNKAGHTSNRGFASMDEDKQREIASKGGKAAHEQGVAHEWDSAEAREAGRKGGQAAHVNRTNNSEGSRGPSDKGGHQTR